MSHVSPIWAVCRRQLSSLLANPMGYVFILVFVFLVNAVCFIPEDFYKRNVADLALLSERMPWILMVLIAAISMGSWSHERERGTEELLLTLPITLSQALLGKYLSIVLFFALALVCSMSCVVILMTLGNPDMGLIACNYIGWFLMGAAFAALSLCASVLSGNQAISFVCSTVLCASAWYGAQSVHWGAALQRGVLSLSDVAIACAFMCIGLGLALFILSSRRWQAHNPAPMRWSALALVAAVVVSLNTARIADRWNMNVDMSVAGLSSLSDAAQDILDECTTAMTITAVMSENIPADFALRAQELQDMLHAIRQYSQGRIGIEILRPIDPLTETGLYVQEQYGIAARPVVSETLAGKRNVELFLGFHVHSETDSSHVSFIEGGMSIEYELLRAIRGIDVTQTQQRKRIGIVSTEIEMVEYPSRYTGALEPSWLFVQDLEKYYDIRSVSADEAIAENIDVLIVPLPSGLTVQQMQHVHDYIWAGRPALLMSDPWPGLLAEKLDDYGIAIAPTLPRYDRYEEGGAAEIKGDIAALYKGLGIRCDLENISWSQYKPDAGLAYLPHEMVWLTDAVGSFADNPMVAGMQSLMCVYPGAIYPVNDSAHNMQVLSLVRMSTTAAQGTIPLNKYLQATEKSYNFTPRQHASVYVPTAADDVARNNGSIAVKIRGHMRRTLATAEQTLGARSAAEANVIVLADIDMAYDYFFTMDNRLKQDNSQKNQHIWASVRNVQFLSNAVDSLAGDDVFVALRRRVQRYRNLSTWDDVLTQSSQRKARSREAAQARIDAQVKIVTDEFKANIALLQAREDMDSSAKYNKLRLLKDESAQYLQRYQASLQKKLVVEARRIDTTEARIIHDFLAHIKWLAIGIPSILLSVLIIIVFTLRVKRERRHIPQSRLRQQRNTVSENTENTENSEEIV